MAELIDELMGFDPTNLSAFADKGPKTDPNIYKTNPKNSTSEDGEYHSKVKILLNPFSPKDSIVARAQYWLASMDGSREVVSSLSEGDKNCPIFKAWKRGHFSGVDAKKTFADNLFDKNESQWVLVQILEDDNQPDLKGQFRMMKLARDIYDKLVAKMNPSASSGKTPYPVMDYVVGLQLEMDVKPGPDDPAHPERKQREISYSVCDFGEYAPVIKTDGTPLFDDDEIELIDSYVTAANDSKNGKTKKKQEDAIKALEELKPQIRPLYAKAIEYVKANLKKVDGTPLDLKKERGYQPWDAATTEFVNKWIEMADDQVDPATMSYDAWKKSKEAPATEPAKPAKAEAPASTENAEPAKAEAPAPAPTTKADDDDLPF